LADANILAFDLLLDDGVTTLQITLGVNAERLVQGGAFSASTSSLLFDFSAGGTQFALFQSPSIGSGQRDFCVQTDGCFDFTVPCQIFGLVQKKSSSKISHPNFLSEIVTCSEFTGNAIFH
jgi:hypothetical protein